jgi:hypothetical protein
MKVAEVRAVDLEAALEPLVEKVLDIRGPQVN